MSEKNKLGNCLFSIEVTDDDVKIGIEGGARDLAETIANVALQSEEVNMVLKIAMLMLAQHEMSEDEDKEDEPQTPVFGGVVGQA